MAIQAASGIGSNYVCRLGPGRDFYRDAELREQPERSSRNVPVDAVYVGYVIDHRREPFRSRPGPRTRTNRLDRPSCTSSTTRARAANNQGRRATPARSRRTSTTHSQLVRREWREWLLAGSPGGDEDAGQI